VENKIYKLILKNGEVVSHKMVTATNIFSRMLGLMFSAELPNCDGFLISPCNSIHTFFMRYPLDVLFLDKNFKIVKVIYGLSPWRMTWIYFKSSHVLEMKAGTMKKGLNAGETLEAICIN
jgi:uncharacterized membrane protein (UPF0127 family)